VRHRAVAADARGQAQQTRRVTPTGDALHAAVHIAEAQFQLQCTLTHAGETEMPRLDDAGMDRADGHLVHGATGHARERVSGIGRGVRRCWCRRRQGIVVLAPGLMPQPATAGGMANEDHAQQIVPATLAARGPGEVRRQAGQGRVRAVEFGA